MSGTGAICCVDIGGSGVKAAAISADGSSFERLPSIATPGGLPELVEHLLGLVAAVPGCTGIAISAPGAVDTKGLRVNGSSAVPYIHENDWPDRLAAASGLPVSIENDANCAGLAEVWYGPEDTPRTIATIVVGTGVGGSIVLDGRVHDGANAHGGEFGYWVLSLPSDAPLLTVSNLASTRTLVEMVTAAVGGSWNGRTVFEAVDGGDAAVRAEVESWYRRLALVVHNVQYSLDPEAILLGGGVSQRPAFLDELGAALDWVYEQLPFAQIRPNIGLCHFQADANLYGALAHFLLQNGQTPR